MHIQFACPACERTVRAEFAAGASEFGCPACGWKRPLPGRGRADIGASGCCVCGCHDLWRQKDFPPALGLSMVGAGILFSTIAWAYMLPAAAIGILMFFAFLDLVLYAVMPDVLVCYRCAARHRFDNLGEQTPKFNLETAERYRQENLRKSQI